MPRGPCPTHMFGQMGHWLRRGGGKIQLLESPIPPARPPQKASHGAISGTKSKCGIIDPLVPKLPEKILNKEEEKKKKIYI